MKTKKILSIFLVMLIMLSLSVIASASDDGYNWERVPTSPEGLGHGDVWFDFTMLCSSDATEEEKAALLARFNAGTWYADFDAAMVKVENADDDLNGTYSRSQEPFICCVKEVDVNFVNVSKSLAGVQVGDYYIDKDAWYAYAVPEFASYYAAQYSAEHQGETVTPEMMEQLKIQCKDIADNYYAMTFTYNPGGKMYRYQINGMPFPYGRYPISYSIGQCYMIIVHALDVSIRQATAETVAASPWVKVETSVENAADGGYYIDFDDPTVLAAMNVSNPTESDIAMIKGGEWYADFSRSVVCGKITINVNGESFSEWTEESSELFHFVKVKPGAPAVDPSGEENDGQEENRPQKASPWKKIVSFFLRLVDFFKKIFG